MTVNVTKPAINLREKLSELDKPSGIAGQDILKADTPQEVFNYIGAGRRNLIINGAMQVAQRGTSATGVISNTYLVDRFQWIRGTGTYTISQSTDAPTGFAYSSKIETTATGTADNLQYYRYKLEGLSYYHLGYGTADAKETTLSFWVKSNIAGTFGLGAIQHSTVQRGSYHHYTIDAADTWQKITLTIPGDTSGLSSTSNTMMMTLDWYLSGDDSGSTPTGAWGARTTNQSLGSGTTEIQSSTSNYWQITGIQWEVGSVATPFEHRSYGEELALCQRYYYDNLTVDYDPVIWTGDATNANAYYIVDNFPVTMRAIPTMLIDGVGVSGFSTSIIAQPSYNGCRFLSSCTSTGARRYFEFGYTADAEL